MELFVEFLVSMASELWMGMWTRKGSIPNCTSIDPFKNYSYPDEEANTGAEVNQIVVLANLSQLLSNCYYID